MGTYVGSNPPNPADEERKRMLGLIGQRPMKSGETPLQYGAGAVKGTAEFLGRIGAADYPFVQAERIATQGIGQKRPPILPELKKIITEPPKILMGKRPPETFDMPLREIRERVAPDVPLSGKERIAFGAASLFSPLLFTELGAKSTQGIARAAGAGAEIAAGEAAAKKAGTVAAETFGRTEAEKALSNLAMNGKQRVAADLIGKDLGPVSALKAVAPKQAKRIGLQAMEEANRVQAEGIQKVYSTAGEASHIGEAANRGDATLFRFKVPGLPAIEAPQSISSPVLRGVAGIGRGIQQTAAKAGLAEHIGLPTAGIREAALTGFAGTKLPGELSATGRAFSKAIPRQRIGEAMVNATALRGVLHNIFESGGGTSVDELLQIRRALDLPPSEAAQSLEGAVAAAQQNRAERLGAIPDEIVRDKAKRTAALLDYMLRKEQASGIPVGEVEHYFPHILTGEYRKYKAATRPTFSVPGSQMRPGSTNARKLQMGIDEANAFSMKEHGFPIFKENALESLWLRSMDSTRAQASIHAYDKFMSRFARPLKEGERLAPGEVAVISPGAFRQAMGHARDLTADEAKAVLNVTLNSDLVTPLGVAPSNAEEAIANLRQLRGLATTKAYAVPAEVARDMNVYSKRLGEEIGDLPHLYSRALQVWKQETLLPFPGYHARNYLGNWTNAWLNGMSLEEMAKHGTTAMRILMAGETGKGLDTAYTIGKRTQTARDWLDELGNNNVLKGGYVGTASRQSGHELIGAKRIKVGPFQATANAADIPSLIPLVPTFRKGAGGFGRRMELSLHNRIGRVVGGLAEGQPRAAVYFWQLEKGAAPEQAMQKVADTLWEFNEIPGLIQKSRGIAPFLAWTFKELPFGFVKMLESPGKSALPARLYFSARASAHMGGPKNEFEADTGAIPIQRKPNGEVTMFPAMSLWAPNEIGRVFPEAASTVGSTFGGREARGLLASGLSLMGPGEQIGTRLGGISRQGKSISGTDISPQKMGPLYVNPDMKAWLGAFRAIYEASELISPSRPRSPMERIAGFMGGGKPFTVNPKQDASRRARADIEALRSEAGRKRYITEPKGRAAIDETLRRIKEEIEARRRSGAYQP